MELANILTELESIWIKPMIEDASFNGLQIESKASIERIYGGVDATLDFFKSAPKPDQALFLVHHGLFWNGTDPSLSGPMLKKTTFCLEHQAALYASHLPLDVHPVYGNNVGILNAMALPVQQLQPFGREKNNTYGFQITSEQGWSLSSLFDRACRAISSHAQLLPYGKETIHSIAVVSGSGHHFFPETVAAGIDLFITGDYAQSMYIQARDYQKNVLLLGHYESEKFGVLSIGHYLAKRFSLEFTFLDISPIFKKNTN